MLPSLASSMAGRAALAMRNVPVRFTARIRSQRSRGISAVWANVPIPATLHSTLGRPEGGGDLADGIDHPRLVGDVTAIGDGLGPERWRAPRRLVETFCHDVQAGHRRSFGGQSDGGGPSDARSRRR